MSTHHSDEVNLKLFLTHLLLDIHKSGLGNRLGVNFEALLSLANPGQTINTGLDTTNLTELFQIPLIAGLLKRSPRLFRKLVRDAVQVELAVLSAFHSSMACRVTQFSTLYIQLTQLCQGKKKKKHTFHFTVLADIGRTLRTLGSGMTLLVANTARSLEHARLGALGLVVTNIGQQYSQRSRKNKRYSPLLATVEASTGRLTRFRTLAGKVTLTTAAFFSCQPFILEPSTHSTQTKKEKTGRSNLLATVTIIPLRATITITISRLETVRVEVLHGLETSIACVLRCQ